MKNPLLGLRDDIGLKLFIAVFMVITVAVVIVPLWFIITASFSDPDAVMRGENLFWFVGFQTDGYRQIFSDPTIFSGYFNSAVYSGFGSLMGAALVIPYAFALSRRTFFARRFLTILVLIPMYFTGGLVPLYLVVRNLGLYNTRFVIIALGSFGAWNVIIARTYFATTLPDELWEAHLIDGGNYLQFFFHIVLPLSSAIIAVIMLFSGVAQWNDFFKGLIFLREQSKWPLQLILRDILTRVESNEMAMLMDVESMDERMRVAGIIRYGLIVVATAPVLLIFPFLQKYLVKGVMLGAVKG